MTNHKASFLVQARRSAWPQVFGVMLSCAVAALALDSATAAFARMGENAATTMLELTPEDDTVQQFCKLGDACGDDSALTGNFRGIWRNATFVEPDPKSFPGIRFIGKVLLRVIPIDPAANRTYHYWHVFVPGVEPGQIYGYRVQGALDP